MLRRVALLLVCLAAIMLSMTSCTDTSKGVEEKQTVQGRVYTLRADKKPVPRGDAEFALSIQDGSGVPLKAEFVHLRFLIKKPAGQLLGPPDVMSVAEPKGDVYRVTVPLQTAGTWDVTVEAAFEGVQEPISKVNFTLDVQDME